jgi:Domain of unknown function (DUF222)
MTAAQLAGESPDEPGRDEWDADAHAARFLAEVDAGRIEIPEPGPVAQGCWVSVAETDPAVLDPASFTQGGVLDQMGPGAVLAAAAEAACDPAVLSGLSDNAILGVVAGSRRLAGRVAAIQLRAVAEYAGRHTEADRKKASRLGFTEFAADDLAPELVVTGTAAEVTMAQSLQVKQRLPRTVAALWDGLLDDYRIKIIAEATSCLTGAGAAEADQILSAAAPGLTPGQLRAMAARIVLMIDPEAAAERKRQAAKSARVEKFREDAGTAALCGRDLPPDAVLASWAHIDTAARALRKTGAPGTLQQLRAAVYLGLTSGMDPLDLLARIITATGENPAAGSRGGAGTTPGAGTGSWPWEEPYEPEAWHDTGQDDEDEGPAGGHPADHNPADHSPAGHSPADGADDHGGPGNGHDEPGDDQDGDDDEDGGDGGGEGPAGGTRPDTPVNPGGTGGTGGGKVAPFPAVITLLVPVGNPYGWSAAPAEIPGYGPLDAAATRDMMQAASAHPGTRWCITWVGPDGTAVGHGCAPGQHPWAPPAGIRDPNRQRSGGGERDGPGHPRDGTPPPGPGTADQQAAAAEFLRRLQVTPTPIAKDHCDHASYTDTYVVPRSLKHLIKARRATCVAPGCNRPAAGGDIDHTTPWPQGPTCQGNLGGLCRYHHRNKQAPGWKLEQTSPGVFKWTSPSGRTRTTRPTRYLT